MKFKLSVLLFALITLTGCTKSDDLQKITVVLDYVPNTNHSGIYLAKENGYYEDEGLDVEIMQPSETAAEGVVSSNNAEFGIASAESLAQFDDENDDLISILALVAHNTSGFISRSDENIKRPRDMENKTYCGWGSDVEQAIVKTVVKADGGDPDKVKITTTSSPDIKNENSPCDVMWVFEGWDKIDMDLKGIDTNYMAFTDYDLDWYTPILFTSRKLVKDNPKLVQSFVNATIKGYEDAIKDPETAAKVLLKYAPELDADLVEKSQEFLSANYQGESPFGYQKKEMWEDFGNWLKDNKIISDDLKINSLYTNEFVENAND